MEQMMTCMNKLSSNSDYTTIMDKKLNAAKTCGATDKNIQCWRTMHKCESDSYPSIMGSPEFQTAKRDANQCYTNNPNNPLAGLESLFMGMHGGKGKGGHHGMGGKTGGAGGEGHDMNDHDDESSEEMMGSDKIPSDCMPSNMHSIMNCTMQALQRDQTVMSSATKLRPQLKQCEDIFTSDCEPEAHPLESCLKKTVMVLFKLMSTNFNACMKTAGFPM
jgi:hypothetical protein